MSILHLNAAWAARIQDPQAKLVLVRLADRADKVTGVCWPSLDELAGDTELHRSTVSRKIDTLEKGGWITRRRRQNGCDYTVNLADGKSHTATCEEDSASRTQRLPKSHAATSQVAHSDLPEFPQVAHSDFPSRTVRLASNNEPTENPKREKSALAIAPKNQNPIIRDEWGDIMPSEQARDFQALQIWINSLHPSWKKRPHFSRIEQEDLLGNSKIFFDLTDSDKSLLSGYMDALIPEDWGKFWQPDNRGQLVKSVTDVLSAADRWERECRKRRVATGIEKTGGAA